MNVDNKKLPSLSEIVNLEKIAKKEGSGISSEELMGIWKFQYVYKKSSGEFDNLSSTLLQVLSATLKLTKKNSENYDNNFEIQNSIKFGLIYIIFSGFANLKGKRPLLPFFFNNLKIKIGNFSLIDKQLKKPETNKMPFFALISLNKIDNWMCARGKGGGLAIWLRV